MTTRSSTEITIGALVARLDRYAYTPILPGCCSAAASSVTEFVHEAGSGVPSAHTFARTVVGLVPIACTRTSSFVPAVADTPGTTTSGAIVENPRVMRTVSRPLDSYRTSAR